MTFSYDVSESRNRGRLKRTLVEDFCQNWYQLTVNLNQILIICFSMYSFWLFLFDKMVSFHLYQICSDFLSPLNNFHPILMTQVSMIWIFRSIVIKSVRYLFQEFLPRASEINMMNYNCFPTSKIIRSNTDWSHNKTKQNENFLTSSLHPFSLSKRFSCSYLNYIWLNAENVRTTLIRTIFRLIRNSRALLRRKQEFQITLQIVQD